MQEFRTGFGRKSITPDYDVPMNSTTTSHSILDPIFVSCVALDDGESTVLLFSFDLRGSSNAFTDPVRQCIESRFGIPASHQFYTATHNHSSPDINFCNREPLSTWAEEVAYPAFLAAAEEALESRLPSEAFSGTSQTKGVNFVRRYFREDGTFHGIHVPKVSDAPLAIHESEADPSVRILRFARKGGRDIILVNWQNHAAEGAVTHKEILCSDFVGPMRRWGEEAEDAYLIYFQGACGNINSFTNLPHEQHAPDTRHSGLERMGKELARAVGVARKGEVRRELGKIRVGTGTLTGIVNHEKTHLAPLVPQVFATKDEKERKAIANSLGFASRYEASAVLRRSKMGPTNEIPLSVLSIGEIGFAFAPFEMFDTLFMSVRSTSPFPFTFTVGYTNGGYGYMPSAYGFLNGGYEPLQCNYMPGTGEQIATKLVRMLKKLQ